MFSNGERDGTGIKVCLRRGRGSISAQGYCMDWQSPHVAQGPDGLSPAVLYSWTSLQSSTLHHSLNHALVNSLREEKFTIVESLRRYFAHIDLVRIIWLSFNACNPYRCIYAHMCAHARTRCIHDKLYHHWLTNAIF